MALEHGMWYFCHVGFTGDPKPGLAQEDPSQNGFLTVKLAFALEHLGTSFAKICLSFNYLSVRVEWMIHPMLYSMWFLRVKPASVGKGSPISLSNCSKMPLSKGLVTTIFSFRQHTEHTGSKSGHQRVAKKCIQQPATERSLPQRCSNRSSAPSLTRNRFMTSVSPQRRPQHPWVEGTVPTGNHRFLPQIPSGELTFCYGKSQFFMGKPTINGHFPLLFVGSPEGMGSCGFSRKFEAGTMKRSPVKTSSVANCTDKMRQTCRAVYTSLEVAQKPSSRSPPLSGQTEKT